MIHYYIVDAQLATPTAPASAVNTVMRILRNFFQSVFIVLRNKVTHLFNVNVDDNDNHLPDGYTSRS